ncbi:alpha/beta hydrolase [Nocardia rhamnosiphila]
MVFVDPELVAPLESYRNAVGAGGYGAIADVHERRALFAEHGRRAAAVRRLPQSVKIEDHQISGIDGNPVVRTRLYRPTEVARSSFAAWVYIHGGGMTLGGIETSDFAAAHLAADSNAVVLSVDYRLSPEVVFPSALDDCSAAQSWLSEQAQEFGVDRDRIGVFGISAGGALAAGVALRSRDGDLPPLAKQVLIYPMLDDRTSVAATTPDAPPGTWSHAANAAAWDLYLGSGAVDRVELPRYAAPARTENLKGLAPAYLEVGSSDVLAVEAISYAQRLVASGVPTELHVVPGAYHAYDVIGAQTRRAADARAMRLRTMADI